MKTQSRRESSRPVVDEAAFQQLLSAAYVMQEHNSRLKKPPQPAAQITAAVTIAAKPAVVVPSAPPAVDSIPFPAAPQTTGPTCQECGSTLAVNKFFCENCGAPAARPNNNMQKNWASLWEMHQASQPEAKVVTEEKKVSFVSTKTAHPAQVQDEEIDLFPSELEEIVGKFSEPGDEESETAVSGISRESLTLVPATPQPIASAESAAVTPASYAWTSAAKARAWLDSLKPQKSKDWFREEWTFHRGMIAIALASAVLLAVLLQWATQPMAIPGQARELSGFEQMLVSMGLAEAPAPVTSTPTPGNPDTKVWVDVHTALYYCPGADLYGKTADGKYTSQLDAQRDHFQPSTLKACD